MSTTLTPAPWEELKALRKASGLSRAAWLRCLGIQEGTLRGYESRHGKAGPAILARARLLSAEGAAFVAAHKWI